MAKKIPGISSIKLQVKRSKNGLGLFAHELIPKNTYIIEYIGPILTNEEADKKQGKYLFAVSNTKTIDGSARSNIARYINHGCRPNCETEIIQGRVFIKTIKNIKPDQELCYDYGKEYFDEFIKPLGCGCAYCAEK